jgi:hypothetical protein
LTRPRSTKDKYLLWLNYRTISRRSLSQSNWDG